MNRKDRLRQAGTIVAFSAALLAPFLLYVWGHVQLVTTGYTIESTEEKLKSLDQENRALRLELARLRAPSRIEERAKKLGFEPLSPARLVVVSEPGRAPRTAPPLPLAAPAAERTP